MQNLEPHNKSAYSEIEELRRQLYEANEIIDAIREGAVDALVLNKDGHPHVYSIESADYTYRILIEKFGEGALSISTDGLILYCNDYFSRLTGIPSNKIIGTNFSQYFEAEYEYLRLKAGLINGPSKGELNLRIEGKRIPVYISFSNLEPTVSAIGVVVTDLTEKRKHEEALVQYQARLESKVNELNLSNANLEQFIHVISHDIKEPLRKILTYTSHLSESRNELLGKSELNSLNVINSSAFRLNSLVDDLVKYAFSATKEMMVDVDLNKVLKEVTDDLELIIKENAAHITMEKLPVIQGSKVQLRQLFSNLISNAIKYGKAGIPPQILIKTEIVDLIDSLGTPGSYCKISISDNGIGIEQKHLSKIFTIFQRLHMRDEYSGNGIGLAICKKIMENHHGKIEVESAVNDGSIFKLFFPVTSSI
ncbi:MAG TPA: ATP-binding protein, partial [Flavobacterium sp.]